MIYTLILKPKFRKILKALVFVMILAFSATLYSCQTTTNVYEYTPEKLKTDEDTKIIEVTTKNDSTINLSDYNVIHKQNYKDSSNTLIIEKTNTKRAAEINLKNIKNIKVEKSEADLMKTTVLIGVLTAGFIAILVWLSSSLPSWGKWNN